MRVLLTGGAGYIGSACLRGLLRQGHDAIAYDDLSLGNAAAVPDSRLIVGDIVDTEYLTSVLRDGAFDAVMHFAAVASVPESVQQPELYYRLNALGTKSVLDAMRQASVWRLVFSSTAATYGFHETMPLLESTPQLPQTPYGASKLSAEWMIRDYARAYGIGYATCRYFNASGADADGEHGEDRRCESHLIPLTLAAALGKRPALQVCGTDYPTRDGSCVRDYVHVEDIAEAHRLSLEQLRPGEGSAYNLGSGEGVTVWEVLRACEAVVGQPIPHQAAPRRPGDPAVLIASSDRARRELGWTPRYPDIRGIVETAWRWHQRYPQGYADRQPRVWA